MKALLSKEFFPVLIALALLVISLILSFTKDIVLPQKFYFGLVLVNFLPFLFKTNKKLFIYLYILIMILGTFNLINIFYLELEFGLSAIIFFNPLFVFLLILFLVLNKDLIHNLFPKKK